VAEDLDPPAVARALVDAFEADGVLYAIGGALVLPHFGVVRAAAWKASLRSLVRQAKPG
jgi:hypothetical protein